MNYLDAAIGFAVVMAVFAGAVTAICESFKRVFKTKSKNVLQVITKLQGEMGEYDV